MNSAQRRPPAPSGSSLRVRSLPCAQPRNVPYARRNDAASDSVTRRQQLALLAPLLFPAHAAQAAALDALGQQLPGGAAPAALPTAQSALSPPAVALPNYSLPGPFQPVRLPQLGHTCTTCSAPAERCRLKINSWVPKGGGRLGLTPPYPLAVITSGFLLGSAQYESYAHRLASWGYCALTYDTPAASALDPVTDDACVALLRDLLDWCRTSAPLGLLCDTNCVLLAGHSRGAKVSALAAAQDDRVRALFLVDPVDNTPWAPLGPGFPSAAAALAAVAARGRSLPVAVVGSALGADCAPPGSNYRRFYDAASTAPAWEVVVRDAGHLQFLDARGGSAMDWVCAAGAAPDAAVSELTKGLMVAWAETMVRGGGGGGGHSGGAPAAAGGASPAGPRPGGGDGGVGPLQCGLDRDGKFIAGLASFDSVQALYATEEALRRGAEGKAGLELSTKLKNFKLV